MYWASSSLRVCTLRLPSVVLSSFFKSLKLSDWLTARALTIPSRILSWMSRSSCAGPRLGAALATSLISRSLRCRSLESACCLATIPPGYYDSENYVEPAESRRHEPIAETGARNKRRPPPHHQTKNTSTTQ